VIRVVAALLLAALPTAALAQTIAPSPAPSAVPAAAATPTPDLCSTGLSAVVSRPTQTTAACVVKSKQFIIESGFQTQTVDAGAGSYTYTSFPNQTIRIGTPLQDVEFDIIPPTALHGNGFAARSDSGIGARWQIDSTPDFAYSVNAIATFATGSNPALSPVGLGSSGTGTFIVNGNVQGVINSVFGYGATLEIGQLSSAGTSYVTFVPSVDLTASLPNNFGLAIEGYLQSHGEGPGTPSHNWFDAALSKDVGNAQLDLNYGISNSIVPAPGLPSVSRHYSGFGVSFLF
jgi:hypothetical protein